MSSNLKVNNILPSTGANIGLGTASGTLNVDGGCKVQVGTALTLGHTQGVQFHTQNLHSQGFEINQINASGIITASSFSGSGANLTSLPSQATIANNADNRLITGGSGVNLNGEANLTFSSNQLTVHTAKLKGNQLLFEPSGTAYIDHSTVGQDIQIRVSTSSSNDTTGPTFKSNGNLAFASGKGIDFSAASGSGSGSDSALLDDYEEGSWSPLWSDATSGGTTTSNNMHGRYTKVGKLVTAHFWTWGLPVQGTNNAMYLQGLPFASGTIGATFHPIGCAFFNMGADNYHNLGLRLANNVTYAPLLFCRKDPGDKTPALFNGFINYYTNFEGTITYLTA